MFNSLIGILNDISFNIKAAYIEGNASKQEPLLSEYNIDPVGWLSIGIIITSIVFITGIIITKCIKNANKNNDKKE